VLRNKLPVDYDFRVSYEAAQPPHASLTNPQKEPRHGKPLRRCGQGSIEPRPHGLAFSVPFLN